MEIKKFNIDGSNVEFVNESYSTRNGFKHVTHCFINGVDKGEHTVHYINRTWECYPFQTAMRGLVNGLIESRTEFLKDKFKFDNDYKILNEKRKKEFEKYIVDDDKLNFYTELKSAIGY